MAIIIWSFQSIIRKRATKCVCKFIYIFKIIGLSII